VNNVSRTLYVGKTQDGSWAVATEESPYLFFEGTSEQEVISLAKRALDFCFSNREAAQATRINRPEVSLSQFFKKRTEKVFPGIHSIVAAE
jgi:predicted RNase H-like HicB family nuclease